MKLTKFKSNYLVVLILSGVILLTLTVFFYNSKEKNISKKVVALTHLAIRSCNDLSMDLINHQTGIRGYIITNDTDFLQPYNASLLSSKKHFTELRILTKYNLKQQNRLDTLEKLINQRTELSKKIILQIKELPLNKNQEATNAEEGKQINDKAKVLLANIINEEYELLTQRKALEDNEDKKQVLLFIILFSASILILILSLINTRKYLKSIIGSQLEKDDLEQKAIQLKSEKKIAEENAIQRAAELRIATEELAFQNEEKEKRAAELIVVNYARSLIEASLDPLVTISADGKITDVNEASIKVTGVEREKLIDTDFSHYFTEPQKAQEGYQQVFEKGFVADYPLTIKHKNGNLTDVLYNASVYKDDKGNVLGVFAAARDVTEQKKVENVLKESEEKFKLIFEKSLAPIMVADDKGNYLDVNKASEGIFEYSKNELMGMNVGDLITTSNQNAVAQYEEYIKKGEEIGEFGFISKKGTLKIVRYQAVRIRPDYNLSIMMDVTDQKQASRYARSLIEASLDPLVTINADGKITDVNEASIKVTGVEREKLIDTDFSNYFTEPQKAQDGYQQVFEKGFVADYPLTIKHKNGNLTDVLYNASLYKDDKGNVLGVFAAARDVTERKMFEKEMIDAKVSAENSAKSKQQFLANMSHEIRTPMSAIIGFSKVVLKTDLTEKQREYISAIKTSSDSLLVLINDILDLAKVEAGKMTFEQNTFEMESDIFTMLHLFDLKIQEKNLKLIKEYDARIPKVLIGDSVRLNQIILNLMSNAIKFTSKGKITISVRLIDTNEQKVTIEFVVADTGIGLDEDMIPSLFESFQQATNSTTRQYGGTGLGLAIVKQLVERQGGTIDVKSKLNEGSTFSFVLSFQKSNGKIESESSIQKPNLEIKKIKVLAVEDMPLNQMLLKIILDDFGFERDFAENGKVAIEKLQANAYDIILMDIQMPVMGGLEATEYIRNKMNSKIPIIALTADVTMEDLKKCKAIGMNDHVAKPIDEQLLYNKIVALVIKP